MEFLKKSMKVPYNFKRFANLFYGKISFFISLVIVFTMAMFFIVSLRVLLNLNQEYEDKKIEKDKTHERMLILEKSKDLIETNLEEANKLLSVLLPDTEDFFSIIGALEKISQLSGFTIKEYVVKLSVSNKEKFSISVGGTGDTNSFVNFLKDYQIGGGRLSTSEKIEFTSSELKSTKVQLNFYHKKAVVSNDIIPKLTDADIDFYNKIKGKLSFDLIQANVGEEQFNYPVKTNPF